MIVVDIFLGVLLTITFALGLIVLYYGIKLMWTYAKGDKTE